MSLRQAVYVALALPILANYTGAALAAERSNQPIPCDDIDSIGRAKMSADGTITLQLRSLWPNSVAESELVFAPDDPQYAEIKHHLGGTKPVPPRCGLNSEP